MSVTSSCSATLAASMLYSPLVDSLWTSIVGILKHGWCLFAHSSVHIALHTSITHTKNNIQWLKVSTSRICTVQSLVLLTMGDGIGMEIRRPQHAEQYPNHLQHFSRLRLFRFQRVNFFFVDHISSQTYILAKSEGRSSSHIPNSDHHGLAAHSHRCWRNSYVGQW